MLAGNSLRKEKPEVAALARAGAFQSNRQRQPLTGFPQSPGILLPGVAIEIDGQQVTGFVREHRIEARDELAAHGRPGQKGVGERPRR